MRRSLLAVLAIAVVLLLQGCFKLDMDFKVNSDDTVSGSMIVAFSEEMYDLMDEDEKSGMFSEDEEVPDGMTVEEWAEDGMKGQKVTFKDVPLKEFSDSIAEGEDSEAGEEFQLYREGDFYHFVFDFDFDELTGGDSGDDDLDDLFGEDMGDMEGMEDLFDEDFEKSMDAMMKMMLKDAEMKISVTFPGKIVETNGEVDGNKVTWDIDLTKMEETSMKMTAKAEAKASGAEKVLGVLTGEDSDSGFPVVPVAIGGVALLAAAGGGLALSRKRKDNLPAA